MTLRGWKEITDHTKLSVRTIKGLLQKKKNPFPVVFISRKPYMTKDMFNKWIEAENRCKK